jgi:alkylation response protein AidB-like acyl-CoA dehydrogenase
MDFQLSDEQVLLRDTTRDLLSRAYDPESRNKVLGTDLGWSREVWSQLADTGILGLGFDPAEAGQIEIMVVLIEIGRRLAPEPVVHAALGPGALIAELGTATQQQLLEDVPAGSFWRSPTLSPACAQVPPMSQLPLRGRVIRGY